MINPALINGFSAFGDTLNVVLFINKVINNKVCKEICRGTNTVGNSLVESLSKATIFRKKLLMNDLLCVINTK